MADHGETLLVMGPDSEENRELEQHYNELGYRVLVQSRASDPEQDAQRLQPEIIIADLAPDALIRLFSRFSGTDYTPSVIVHSPIPQTETVLKFLRAGASDVVLKPLEALESLDAAVKRQALKVAVYRQNRRYRKELEQANRELRAGLDELKADQDAGRHVQMKMLPENNAVLNGLSFNYCIKPSLYLSGDFFDYFALDSERVLFYFADVSGHGASSAFVTVLLKNLSNRLRRNLRRGSSDDLSDPASFVNRVNLELLETRIGKHLTVFAGIFNVRTLELIYTVGAHFPLPVLTQANQSLFLEGKGPPVGLLPKAEYPVYKRQLKPGFSLVVCSDGLLEVISAANLEEKERALLETVRQAGHTIPELEKAFGLKHTAELPDDIAIVCISEVDL